MIFAEDLLIGSDIECGTVRFDAGTMHRFAIFFDPQPFHLKKLGTHSPLFEAVSASGLHVAAATSACVLNGTLGGMACLGSPGALELRMHRPVYANTTLRVVQRFTDSKVTEDRPGVAWVTDLRQAFATDGSLIMSSREVTWIASRRLDPSMVVDKRPADAAGHKTMMTDRLRIDGEANLPAPGEVLSFECLSPGASFLSEWHQAEEAQVGWFQSNFDGVSGSGGWPLQRDLANRWITPALMTRIMVDSLWSKCDIAGGGGLIDLAWPGTIAAGDRLRVATLIVEARPLRSRPDLGLIGAYAVCANHRNEIVGNFKATAFLKRRQ